MNQFNPQKHHRQSIRLRHWDYRSPGYYFVTLCTHQRQNLFQTKALHEIVANALEQIPAQPHASHLILDEWVVMPNHIHVIFIFTDYPPQADLTMTKQGFNNALAGSLGVVVGQYKSNVTKRVNNLRRSWGQKVWQRGYYERVIRNEQEWRSTQVYIQQNPARWAEDRDNLDALLQKMTYHP